ncbi:MAG: hypothetical protein A2508_05150 [Candidatus Lambdaproteobacteria bacterium RIFOXYD12_FULL_49_8]|uniref:Uncharacterized protein n=1 Tax=Candidatus Lambdaproteobacteria bacterium RIFOXYD2_FULL_50_16 TaxID=1817772 RepID=A0A1F6GF22_9PROT|nr:MAG: hypothetical protein A2527_03895 [Candidatus Lambdaproteobacteria bacterium RIFOXYD2_FULL_50_16]OGG97551.1 MAG: hypothetical protein A2508_05150 [Candidatus Lambdaproteobacteria bacterium RIFOXYD12_FULL_49_8]
MENLPRAIVGQQTWKIEIRVSAQEGTDKDDFYDLQHRLVRYWSRPEFRFYDQHPFGDESGLAIEYLLIHKVNRLFQFDEAKVVVSKFSVHPGSVNILLTLEAILYSAKAVSQVREAVEFFTKELSVSNGKNDSLEIRANYRLQNEYSLANPTTQNPEANPSQPITGVALPLWLKAIAPVIIVVGLFTWFILQLLGLEVVGMSKSETTRYQSFLEKSAKYADWMSYEEAREIAAKRWQPRIVEELAPATDPKYSTPSNTPSRKLRSLVEQRPVAPKP